jgi:hypothetical protein
MSIQVVVSSTAAGVSVSGGTAVAITVGSVSSSVPVTVGGGIGPAGFIVNPGTASSAFGTFQLAAGDGITISTSVGQFQIASYGTTAVSSLAPVQSVAGRVGAVQLQASDVTAGTFAIARIPTISYTALANVPATFSPSAHTHSTSDVASFTAAAAAAAPVQSVAGRSGAISLTAADVSGLASVATSGSYTSLQNVPASFAPQAHTHSTSDVASFTAAAAAAAPVQSVAGRSGAISLTAADVSGLASVATSGSYTSLQNVPASFAPQAHTHSTADVVGLTASFSQVAHSHQYVQVLNGLTGTVSIAAGAGVTVSTASSSITISAAGGGEGGSYTLPTATSSVLGGIKVGSGLTITDGVLAATGGGGGGSANIVEARTAAGFPATGSVGTLYHATDVRRIFFWDASGVYVESGPGAGSSFTSVPDSPTGLTATRGPNNATLSWTAPSDNGSAITGYVVQYAQAGTTNWVSYGSSPVSGTSVTLSGLSVGTFYQLRVYAINAVGSGTPATLSGNVMIGPVYLSGSKSGSGSLNASWSGVGDSGDHLVLPSTYYNSSNATGQTVAVITAQQNGIMYFFYTTTGSSGRSVIMRRNGSEISNQQSLTSSTTVSLGDVIRFEFFPADAGDRITIDAHMI